MGGIRDKVLQSIENGELSEKDVVMMCLKWMPEDSIADMLNANEINLFEEYDE